MSSAYDTSVPADGIIGETGWRPDPTGRHEGRYFIGGQPTDLTRDGGQETVDPIPRDTVGSKENSTRRPWLVVSMVVLVLLLAAAGVGAYLYLNRVQVTPDDQYLTALKESGLAGEFNSDANALAHGRQVCRQLSDGGPQQGMPADEVAVQHFCPAFAEGFHVLETTTVTGSFTLIDDSPNAYYPSIKVDGGTCTGSNGYSDINAGTVVTIKNGTGEILTTAYLEPGTGTSYRCAFAFTFNVTEGQDQYVVSVGRRGELSFTFGRLKADGVALELGDR